MARIRINIYIEISNFIDFLILRVNLIYISLLFMIEAIVVNLEIALIFKIYNIQKNYREIIVTILIKDNLITI